MLETTCENILSTDPNALTQPKNSSTLALVSFGHDIFTACKGTGRATKHANHQHDERTRNTNWSQYNDRNKPPPADARNPGQGKWEWKWCGGHKHWGWTLGRRARRQTRPPETGPTLRPRPILTREALRRDRRHHRIHGLRLRR